MPNVFNPEWDEPGGATPAPFTTRGASVGRQAGAERLGASLYELAPGQANCPFHYHYGNEEMLIVLAGRPTLRTLEGERELEPGEVVAFHIGPDGAHRLDNRTNETVRVLIVSTMRSPEVVVYPDSDKIGARSLVRMPKPGEPERLSRNFLAGDAVGYWEGEGLNADDDAGGGGA